STLYVSLEPSSHHDQTPPGVDLLLQHRIPRVVVGTIDPNPLVAGRGIARLRAAGVMVVVAPDPRPALHLLGGFALRHREKRPQVLLKYAQSHDGFMGLPNRPVWLSNAYSKRLVHRWRSRIDAILIGTNTAHCDNPRLTTRLFPGPSPLRIVLDRRRRLSPKLHLFTDGHPTLLVTERSEWTAQWSEVPAVEVLHLPFDQTLLPRLLGALLERGVDVVMVEGGARLLGTFIEAGLWDEARVFTASAAL
ncbi:MAG: bifunctional diaminohydroxyphosphoribosylaminopyrimidine deaminase/5-amino-6-(5-phosphoribosylamino)uracil reductase RibD, partial [Bacteroidota bacterium]